ncbi:MAG: alpha/beta fold hydrolase [Vicinamibacterales bacterium]
METVLVDGRAITYERAGNGPPVVFVHGYVGDRRTWRRQIDDLADEFTVVAWDAPGFGGSFDPPDTFALGDYAEQLAGFVVALGFDRVHLVGLSFGGGLIIEFYRRYPGMVASLVLASAYAGWAGSLPRDEVDRRLHQALELAELTPEQLASALMPTMFSSSAPSDLVAEFETSLREFHRAGLRATSFAFAAADVRDVLPTIRVPTLLIYGDADVRAPIDVARAIERAIPSPRVVLVPGAGHIVNIEAHERFDAEVRAFFRSVDAS